MNRLRIPRAGFTLLFGLSLFMLASCVVTDGGFPIGIGYYDPLIGEYGGWGPDYRVGPPRQGASRQEYRGEHSPARGYRPAPAGHSVPSIPSRGHSESSRSRK